LNVETNLPATGLAHAHTHSDAPPACMICNKPIAENQWFCRLTQKVNEAANPQPAKILLCSPACALRHFTPRKAEQS